MNNDSHSPEEACSSGRTHLTGIGSLCNEEDPILIGLYEPSQRAWDHLHHPLHRIHLDGASSSDGNVDVD